MKNLWNTIKDLTADAVSLDVTTCQGSLTLKVSTANDKPTTFGALYKDLQVDVGKPSEVRVVALTHVSLDKDTVTIIGDNPDATLLQQHQDTVRDATSARTAIIRILGGVLD